MICKKCNTEISKTNDYVQLIENFRRARYFLECHPATGMGATSTFESNFCYSAEPVCKNGYYKPLNGKITLYHNKKNYERYKELFDKETEIEPELKAFNRIEVPYKDHFGAAWKFDHIEWWGELCFVLFNGKNVTKCHDFKDWGSYQGVSVTSNSYEELVIKMAKEFKRIFGNFEEEDFLTKEEKENHKKEMVFRFADLKNKKGYSELKKNKNYIRVTPAEINLRWKKWFLKTDYAKKHWPDIVKGETW